MRISMEDLHFLRLWDIYHGLLTKTQQEITNLYFNCDLSLAEIAEEKGCSRQSVSDCLAVCRRQLEEYEEKLHFSRIMRDTLMKPTLMHRDLIKAVNEFPEEYGNKILEILDRDYSEEIEKLKEYPELIY